MDARTTPERLFLDDIAVGDIFVSDTHQVDVEQIVQFATQFDPQPFHLAEEAANETFFQGLAASGWHTASITMRLLVQSIPLAQGVIGAGAEISWPQATRPGDILQVTSKIIEIIPSRSRPDRAIVVAQCTTSNQKGELLQRMVTKILCFKRGG